MFFSKKMSSNRKTDHLWTIICTENNTIFNVSRKKKCILCYLVLPCLSYVRNQKNTFHISTKRNQLTQLSTLIILSFFLKPLSHLFLLFLQQPHRGGRHFPTHLGQPKTLHVKSTTSSGGAPALATKIDFPFSLFVPTPFFNAAATISLNYFPSSPHPRSEPGCSVVAVGGGDGGRAIFHARVQDLSLYVPTCRFLRVARTYCTRHQKPKKGRGVVRNGLCVRGFNLLVGGLWLSGTTRHALFCREKRRRFSTPVAHSTARLRGLERLEHQGTIRQGNCSPATGRICKERRLMENMKKRLN